MNILWKIYFVTWDNKIKKEWDIYPVKKEWDRIDKLNEIIDHSIIIIFIMK